MLAAVSALNDGEKPDIDVPFTKKMLAKKLINGTEVEEMLKEYNLI